MEKNEFELMYNFIYKNYKKNEIKAAIDGVCNYIANKQIKNYNKKMLAELLKKLDVVKLELCRLAKKK